MAKRSRSTARRRPARTQPTRAGSASAVGVAQAPQNLIYPPAPEPPTANRIERILVYMVGGIFGVAMLCFIALIIAWLTIGRIPGSGVWPTVLAFPLIGLPIGMLLIVALLAITWTKRARENRDGPR